MSGSAPPPAPDEPRPGVIDAKPVRHPGRWVAVAVIAIVIAMMISSFVTNPKWDWPFVFKVMNYSPVLEGLAKGTIIVTVASMIIGVTLGILLAIMRLSDNPVLRGVSFVYTWFFRAVPRYVLMVILGLGVLYLYPTLDIGVPFMKDFGLTFYSLDVKTISSGITVGIIGLGLSEAAYMAEIARAGILSVDRGQREAAEALGMDSSKTMRRIVLPQAMRVIVPPTGNEAISMVKDTSLLVAVPVSAELFYQAQVVANNTYKIMPSYFAALLWYLIICSVLMLVQARLERKYGRGFGGSATDGGLMTKVKSLSFG
ncbi:ABC transporter permease [Dermacoccus sp. PE3]|uniref:amino acid ABC transporter permease n=1 Tax=Dermacoccus sp. PE3 TaxID=1641401 RepID=UPI0006427A78|nr:amino acid ABC transporter permease [Dermacoccus sp. PE3]KLO63335.1 ABC transporter permease [Dermacoccus sp. PE3]